MASMQGATDKSTLRRAVLERRRALSPTARSAGDAARTGALLDALAGTAGLRGTRTVTCYLSVGAEPDTRALLAVLAREGVTVMLPRLRADGGLDWTVGDPVGRGLRGAPEATGPAVDPRTAEVWLVPALAVDLGGGRLGRGGGSYDRVLPTDRPVVALLHDDELVETLPTEPHDRPVSHVALPSGVVPL